jgi:cell division protein FtsB
MCAVGVSVQMKNLFDKLFQGFFVAVFVAIVATGLVITLPKYRQAAGLEKACADLQHRIDLKKAEIAAVKERQVRFRTDREFVESLAREHRRAFPGEIVFTFDN